MNKNLFEVGESVVLQSKHHAKYDGEYKIQAVEYWEGNLATTGEFYKGFSYTLGFVTDTGHQWFTERVLFKKHDGCGQDYNEMIKTLNTTIVEWA